MVKRVTLNRIIDVVAFVGFTLVATTGFLLHVLFPPGSGGLHGLGAGRGVAAKPITFVWGLTRHDWGNIHFWIAVGLMVTLAVHLVLHWRWIVCGIRGRPHEHSALRAGLGLVALVLILALVIIPWLSPPVRVSRAQLNADSSQDQPFVAKKTIPSHIHGGLSLQELEQRTGVPVAYVREQLGLPPDISPQEQRGRLRQRYPFTLQDVRRIVNLYQK